MIAGKAALCITALVVLTTGISHLMAQTGDTAPKTGADESAKKVRELRKERIETLKALVEINSRLVKNARMEISEGLESRLMLLKAEVEASEKDLDSLTLYKSAIDDLKVYEEVAISRVNAGRGTQSPVLKVKATRLELEIQMELLKGKQAKGK